MRQRWYVGLRSGKRFAFKADTDPTQATHGDRFDAVTGPFRTKRAAFWAVSQFNNPHFQTINDAERISKGADYALYA